MLKGYTPFIVIIKYWLYSLCCIIYLYSLFILYIVVCILLDPTVFSPISFPLLTSNHCLFSIPFYFLIVLTSLF